MASEMARVMAGFPEVSSPARASNIIQVTGVGELDVFHDCARLAKGASMTEAAAAVVAGMNRVAISQCPFFAVHSGVASRNGRVVALPAASGHGKTTLTAALVTGGFEFISDEALVFDDQGTVLPYPKPFAFSPWSAEIFGRTGGESEILVTPDELGGEIGKPGRLTDLVVSEYGHHDMSLVPLPKSQAVSALITYSFNHFENPERAFRIATSVARETRVWRLEYDDPLRAGALLADALH
jgi:hypothetical protein